MTLTKTLTKSTSAQTSRITGSDAIRRRALERLYQRKEAIDGLIASLETYQRYAPRAGASFQALTKCS